MTLSNIFSRTGVGTISTDEVVAGSEGLQIRDLRKTFRSKDQSAVALGGVSLDVKRGEVLALLGPSGCGKTTTLRCIAGLEEPDAGSISLSGRVLVDPAAKVSVPPERRHIGMVFQSYALWPHMSAHDNVAYPLRRMKAPRRDIPQRVQSALDSVECGAFSNRYPSELSGGQQQRIALARAMVMDPEVLLFDEPLSNLDAQLREQMRFELLQLHERLGFTAVYVTHDRTEAMTIASRIAVMRDGSVIQVGSAMEIYDWPQDRDVAEFMGPANIVQGVVEGGSGSGTLRLKTALGPVGAVDLTGDLSPGDTTELCIRPEQIALRTSEDRPEELAYSWTRGSVDAAAYFGAKWVLMVDCAGHRLRVDLPRSDLGTGALDLREVWIGLPGKGGDFVALTTSEMVDGS